MRYLLLIAIVFQTVLTTAQSVTPYIRKAYVDTITNSAGGPKNWDSNRKGWVWMEGMRKTADSLTVFDTAENDSVMVNLTDKNYRFAGTATDYTFYRRETPAAANKVGIDLQMTDAGGGALTYAAIRANLNATSGAGSGDGELLFYTHNDASLLERGRIDEDGNVMWGTTGGTARLTVSGVNNLATSDALSIKNFAGTDLMLIQNDGNVGIGTSTPAQLLQVSGGDANFDGGTLFVDASADRVGVGISSPNSQLHVQRSSNDASIGIEIENTNTGTASAAHLLLRNSDTRALSLRAYPSNSTDVTGIANSATVGTSTVSAMSLTFYNASDGHTKFGEINSGFSTFTEYARFDQNGNFGIGTTSPSSKLDVVGTSEFSDDANFDNSTLFVDASTNRIGIGTSTPGFPVQLIEPGIGGGATRYQIDVATAASGGGRKGIVLGYDNLSTIGVIAAASGGSNGNLSFEVGANLRAMHIQADGDVGINTESPNASAALDISSTSRGFLPPRMTALQASAITPVNGLMLYVTSTDATFTSIGFWGYENGAWVKL